MAYNNRNLLKKIVVIQDITLQEKQRGASQVWIFENLIKEQYCISMSTYSRYLSINAKADLKRIKNK
jgi:hypothetical protein